MFLLSTILTGASLGGMIGSAVATLTGGCVATGTAVGTVTGAGADLAVGVTELASSAQEAY